jgi:hypothetical protein
MRPRVFYPAKSIDKVEIGHYSVELRRLGRMEFELDHWYVEVQRCYVRVSAVTFKDIGEARAAFELAQEGAIIAIGCEAFNLTVPPIIMLPNVTQAKNADACLA